MAESHVKDAPDFGPTRPEALRDIGYNRFGTKHYLEGHAAKILHDLVKLARLYNGHKVTLFIVDRSKRCPKCTNLATGEKLVSNCPICHGTGFQDSWEDIGDFWCQIDFDAATDQATPYGNTENANGQRQGMVILGAPLLPDQTLVRFCETGEIFKIYDVEPTIVAMRGDVIAQLAQCTRLTPGNPEYTVLEKIHKREAVHE